MAGGPDVTSVGVFGSDVSALLQTASKNAPTTAADLGYPGQLAFDAHHLYICTAPNSWASVPLQAMATQAKPQEPEYQSALIEDPAEPAKPKHEQHATANTKQSRHR